MARNLYRIYLYVVSIGMLIFAAVGAGSLLNTILSETGLRGAGNPAPTQAEVVQSITLAAVSWVVAGAIGGFHYWLIRRDMAGDPKAGTGAIRSFFLNIFEALAALVAVNMAVSGVSQLAYADQFVATQVAAAFAAAGVVAALEWERRRTQAAPGTATVLQRLHLYGVPFLIVLTTASLWQDALRLTALSALGSPERLDAYAFGYPYGGYAAPHLWPLWIAVLISAAAWSAYGLLARGDLRSALRQVLHLLGFGFGVAMLVVGADRGVELAVRRVAGLTTTTPAIADFISALLFGALVAAVYGAWLMREAAYLPMGPEATGLTAEAGTAAILAVPFWWGGGLSLYNLIESNVAGGSLPSPSGNAFALGLLLTGVAYVPFDLHLRRRSARTGITGPRRAFVLGLLAAGTITGAVGGAVALYALGTSLLGAPLGNWQQTARAGGVAFATGAILAAIYGWTAAREHAFGALRLPAPHAPAAAPAAERDAADELLDEFAAGKISHEVAAERIRELMHAGS